MIQQLSRIRLAQLISALTLIVLGAVIPSTETRAQVSGRLMPMRAQCDALPDRDFSRTPDAPTQIMATRLFEAEGEIPPHCWVEGYVAPQVGFELRLPTEGWNGKFLEIGCGGPCGVINSPEQIAWCNDGLRRGYACLVQDRGHRSTRDASGKKALRDFLWAYNNLQAEVDSGFRAGHVTAVAGKAITENFYGRAPRYSYFMGCSGGGRQALMEAQRFPTDFDGIIAGAPSARFCETTMALRWIAMAGRDAHGQALFTSGDIETLHNAVLAKCDKLDGLRDGIIGDPRKCAFDPAEIACSRAQSDHCLSPAQVEAARKIYEGPRTRDGKKLFFGSMPGSEKGQYTFGASGYNSSEMFRYQAFMPDPGPDWDPGQFDFDRDYRRLGLMGVLNDASNPDLRQFKANGGKLLIYQGWDDSGSPLPLATIDYYEMIERVMGGSADTRDFARLFMLPGVKHCGGGVGANAFDFLGYLEAWVERGEAPDMLIGAHQDSDAPGDFVRFPADPARIKFTRPVYAYPLSAKYSGRGDPNDYRNFIPSR